MSWKVLYCYWNLSFSRTFWDFFLKYHKKGTFCWIHVKLIKTGTTSKMKKLLIQLWLKILCQCVGTFCYQRYKQGNIYCMFMVNVKSDQCILSSKKTKHFLGSLFIVELRSLSLGLFFNLLGGLESISKCYLLYFGSF